MCRRPAVSRNTRSLPWPRGVLRSACLAISTGSPWPYLKHGNAELCADDLELLDRGGTVHVARDEQRALALALAHERGELRAVRRFTGALQTDEHHDARRTSSAMLSFWLCAAHEGAQLLVDDLDDHLRRGEALEHVRADGALGDRFDKVLDDLVAHVGLEQRETHLAHGLLYVRLRQAALAAELFENVYSVCRKDFQMPCPSSCNRGGDLAR